MIIHHAYVQDNQIRFMSHISFFFYLFIYTVPENVKLYCFIYGLFQLVCIIYFNGGGG